MTSPPIASELPEGMPDADSLIGAMRDRLAAGTPPDEVLAEALAEWPVLGHAAPVPVLAKWLGMREQSIYTARTRKRSDGSPVWPDPDAPPIGNMKFWTFATVALGRATAPGKGWRLAGELTGGAR